MQPVRSVIISGLVILGSWTLASADDNKLRLNFDEAPVAAEALSEPQVTLDEMLSVSPRSEGLNMSVHAPVEGSTGVGLGFGDTAFGVTYEVFTSFATQGADRFGLSGLSTGGLGRGIDLNSDLSLAPKTTENDRLWQFGGRLGYGGFSFGADYALQTSLAEQAEYRDYRLGVSYAGESWSVGMQYVRSLQATPESLLGVADAVELGGAWSLTGSVDLIGGVQFWDQQELTVTDGQTSDALIFFGTRIQF